MPQYQFEEESPVLKSPSFVAPGAQIIGRVTAEHEVSFWYNCTVRGDLNSIAIGAQTNVQDSAILHVTDEAGLTIGSQVTIGHGAILHACSIGSRVLIGMGAIVLDGAVVEDECIIGAGALIPPGKRIPAGSLVLGSPGQVTRELTADERASLARHAERYSGLAFRNYLGQLHEV
ncbi:MAG: gamma carbonic anhydrase family protein [Bacillota bacterium]